MNIGWSDAFVEGYEDISSIFVVVVGFKHNKDKTHIHNIYISIEWMRSGFYIWFLMYVVVGFMCVPWFITVSNESLIRRENLWIRI